MSRLWNSLSCVIAIGVAGLSSAACTAEVEYALRQPITMGPWTFEVERATERVETRGALRLKVILVTLELHNYKERHEKAFDDFMSGEGENAIMTTPNMTLVDEVGNRFDLEAFTPLSGGSLRSERWRARFPLIEFSFREDSSETAARHIDKHVADFRLIIENPDYQRGQPRKASIQLQ